MNVANLIGRLAKDPEVTYTKDGKALAKFILVNNEYAGQDKPKKTNSIPVIAWGKLAEVVGNNLQKGMAVGVSGSIQTGSYDKANGERVYTFEVVLFNNGLTFLGKKPGASPLDSFGTSGPADEEIPF